MKQQHAVRNRVMYVEIPNTCPVTLICTHIIITSLYHNLGMAARVEAFFLLSFIVVLHSQAMRDYLGWDLWQRATNETRKKLMVKRQFVPYPAIFVLPLNVLANTT